VGKTKRKSSRCNSSATSCGIPSCSFAKPSWGPDASSATAAASTCGLTSGLSKPSPLAQLELLLFQFFCILALLQRAELRLRKMPLSRRAAAASQPWLRTGRTRALACQHTHNLASPGRRPVLLGQQPAGSIHSSSRPAAPTICSLLRCALRAPRHVGRLQRHSSERRLAAESTPMTSSPTTQG
jgi:hypothetical protein